MRAVTTVRVALLTGTVLARLVTACGADDTAGAGNPVGGGGAGGAGTYTTPTAQQLSEFAASWEAAYCDAIASCCAEAGLPTSGTCIFAGVFDETWPTEPARVGFDAALATQCLTGLAAALAEECSDKPPASVAAICRRVFQGLVPVGGVCSSGLDCVRAPDEYAFCEPSGPPPALGTCITEPIPAAPPTCEVTCRGDGSAGAPGDCACADGSYCASSSTCQPKKPAGAPCTGAPGECLGQCDGSTGLCAGMLTLVCAGRP